MISEIRHIRGSLILALAFSISTFAKCPIPEGGTLIIRAASGDLHVDTSSRDSSVDVQIENNAVQLQENCGKDVVQLTGTAPDQSHGPVGWKIVTPKNVNLDLVTMAGNITVGDVDGDGSLDVMVGAPGNDDGGTDNGAAYIFFGPVQSQ